MARQSQEEARQSQEEARQSQEGATGKTSTLFRRVLMEAANIDHGDTARLLERQSHGHVLPSLCSRRLERCLSEAQ